jgi:hypothetical protein
VVGYYSFNLGLAYLVAFMAYGVNHQSSEQEGDKVINTKWAWQGFADYDHHYTSEIGPLIIGIMFLNATISVFWYACC